MTLALIGITTSVASGQRKQDPPLEYPPRLPGGGKVAVDTSPDFLRSPIELPADVRVAETPPTVDFLYYPGQTYPGKPWSNWGDSLVAGGKYYASIGDHLAPQGNAFVYEYDPAKKSFRLLCDVKKLLDLPEGHYVPGKIHGRLDMGNDGQLYFSTHRGSTRVTTDEYHYRGDWVLRTDPKTAESEIVTHGPVPKHCIPNSLLDPERMIFYGGTAPGRDDDPRGVQFFAYDVAKGRVIHAGPHGPKRYMMLARSTGKLYYVPDDVGVGPLMCFDPADPSRGPGAVGVEIGMRAATDETDSGVIYTASQEKDGSRLFAFDVKSETVRDLGPLAVGSQSYVASLDADRAGRFLYYVPGAHGGSVQDGSPVVRFDTRTGRKKVIAFLHPFYAEKYGAELKGTYSTALSPEGDTLYVTWNVSRGSRAWDCCALTAVHIPESER